MPGVLCHLPSPRGSTDGSPSHVPGLLAALLLVVGTWVLFSWERADGASLEQARTAALNLLVAASVLYLFHCRSLVHPARRLGLLSNPWVIGGVAVQVVAQLLLTYVPLMQGIFDTAALSAQTWVRLLAIALIVWVVIGIDKRCRAALSRRGERTVT